jgi:hypothetical protein
LDGLSLMKMDTQRRLAKIESMLTEGLNDLTSKEPLSGERACAPTAGSDAIAEVQAREALTPSELAALSPVARQILSEIFLGLAKTSGSVDI